MAYSTEYVTATYAAHLSDGTMAGYVRGERYTLWIDRVATEHGTEIHILYQPTHQIKVRYSDEADFRRDWIDIQPKE